MSEQDQDKSEKENCIIIVVKLDFSSQPLISYFSLLCGARDLVW
jgi:hypothetical protein